MKVSILGIFEICLDEDKRTKADFAEKSSIAILFPYLRALKSVYSANANIGTLILPAINVVKYLEDKRKMSSN